jgi:peptidoglycan/LPS O-acetylase OafA/YrhL
MSRTESPLQDTPAGVAAPPSHSPAPRIHLDYLDGIRALAALWVAVGHWWAFQYSVHPGITGALTNWMFYNHLPVDGFIVLSGFCLMMPVSRSGRLSGGAMTFYLRRARRILPPFYAALILAAAGRIIVQHLKHDASMSISSKDFLYNALLLQDWLPSSNHINAPFWSVAAEWKIYFLFPLFLLIRKKWGTASMLAVSAAIGVALTILLHTIRPYYNPDDLTCPWYVFLFTLGVAAAHDVFSPEGHRIKWEWVGAAFVVFSALVLFRYRIAEDSQFSYYTHQPLIDVVCGVLFASFLAILTIESPFAKASRKLLALRPLVAIGTFAYSLYLFHLPILIIVQDLVNRVFASHSANAREAIIGIVGLPAAVIGCYLFFLLFERPFLVKRSKETAAETARDAVLAPAP